MEATRRFRSVAAASALLALLGALTGRSVLLAAATGVAALLIAVQTRFLVQLRALDSTLSVEASLDRTHVRKGSALALTLSASRAEAALAVDVEADLPPSVRPQQPPRIYLDAGEDRARTAVTLSTPVVGTATLDGATVRTADRYGLFRESLPRGETRTITVEARRPRNVHVGQGGERAVSTLGGHRSGRLGQGVDPAELREYVPGDEVSDIDWKATARLLTPHVREYEVETDRRTLFYVDHRSALGRGPEGETMLDYHREVALSMAESAVELDDPLGLYAVGDGGTTAELQPSTNPRQYERIRRALLDLRPTGTTETASARATEGSRPSAAKRKANRLGGESSFERTLRPYLETASGYLTRITEDPLFRTVKIHHSRLEGSVLSVVFTDDSDRVELREAVSLASRGPGHVLVFLTPQVLFEQGGFGDVEAAYDRYSDFESFRRDLDRMDGVTVYEVGPGDRIDALLANRRRGAP